MNKLDNVDFIFINEYIYQFEKRLYKFEHINQYKLVKKTQITFFKSWSLTKSSFFVNKKTKQTYIDCKYLKILKDNSLNKKTINFMDIELFNALLLKTVFTEIKLKKYINQKNIKLNKFFYCVYNSNLFLLKYKLEKSLVFNLVISNNKDRFNYCIINSYTQTICSKFTVFYKNIKMKFQKSKKNTLLESSTVLIDKTKDLMFIDKIENIFRLNTIFFLDSKKLLNSSIKLKDIRSSKKNVLSFSGNTNIFMPRKIFEKTFLKKSKIKKYLIHTWRQKKIKLINEKYNHSQSKLNKIQDFFKELTLYNNRINYEQKLFKFFTMKIKKKSILFSLDKQVVIFKIKTLLIYLLLLKPKSENNLSDEYYFARNKVSTLDAIKRIIHNLKIKSKYFMHFLFSYSFNSLILKTEKDINFSYFKFNSFQLKTLLKRINLESIFFDFIFKILYFIKQKFIFKDDPPINNLLLKPLNYKSDLFKKNVNIIKRNNINFLLFNILFSGLNLTIKHSFIIKNARIMFLSLKYFYCTKKISILLKQNLIKSENYSINSLPTLICYQHQILFLTDDSKMISDSLILLKKFLYLQGFNLEASKIKLGHTLMTYNNNSAGCDFLGFFLCQYKLKTNKNEKPTRKSFQFSYTSNYFKKTQFVNSNLFLKKPYEHLLEEKKHNLNLSKKNTEIIKLIQHSDTILITTLNPSKKEIRIYFEKLKKIVKNSNAISQENLIFRLSNNIRIWSSYYNIIFNKNILQYFDYLIFKILWRWCCRRHPNKNKKWIKYKYFQKINGKGWVFAVYNNTASSLICLPNHTDIKLLKSNY